MAFHELPSSDVTQNGGRFIVVPGSRTKIISYIHKALFKSIILNINLATKHLQFYIVRPCKRV